MQIKFAPSSSNWTWTCDVWSQYLIDCVKMLHIIHSFRCWSFLVWLFIYYYCNWHEHRGTSMNLKSVMVRFSSKKRYFLFVCLFAFSMLAETRDKRIHWLCKWYNIIHFIYAIAIAKENCCAAHVRTSAHETWKLNYPVKCDMVTATNANES